MQHPQQDREIRLLLLALRAPGGEKPLGRFREALDGSFDGERLVEMAYHQEVHPLLARAVQLAGADEAAPWLERLDHACQKTLARNLFLKHELERLTRVLDHAGIRSLALKGPVFAERLYGNLALRTSGDLDLCVRGADVERAVSAIRNEGFRFHLPLRRRDVPRFLPFDKSLDLISTKGPVTVFVDLHWDLTAGEQMIRVDLDGVWRRAEVQASANGSSPGLCAEDLLLFLALHGYNHGWHILKQVCDVDALVRRDGASMDWTAVAERARRWMMADILERALRLSASLLETPLPGASTPCLEGGYWREDPLTSPETFIEESPSRSRPAPAAARWLARFRDRRGTAHRARHVVGSFHPRSMDFLALPEAGKRPWVARLLRPFRVAGKLAGETLAPNRGRNRSRPRG